MAYDSHSNFGYSVVVAAPVPALAGLSLTVATGQGALFPATPFNATVWPASSSPTAATAEIVRVTAVVGDVLTIVRAQEGSTARSIVVGDQIANTTTVKVFTDIENSIIQEISAGGAVATASQVVFDNANGVSFGVAGQTVTASVAVTASQSTQPVAASASNGSFLFSTLNFSNASNVTFATAPGGIIRASVAPPGGGVAISAGANSTNSGTVVFSDSNNVSFGMDGFGVITATVSGAGQSTQPVAASASNGSFLFSTLNFSNANNVTFGTSAGGIITASVNTAAGGGSLNVSAGTTSNNLTNLVFSNSNGVTFGLNASTITASYNSTSVFATTVSRYQPPWGVVGMGAADPGNNNMYFAEFDVPCALYASRINYYISISGSNLSVGNNTGSGEVWGGYGLYAQDTGANSQSLTLLTSYTMTILRHSRSSNTQYAATHYIGLSNATSHSTSQILLNTSNASTYLSSSVNGLRAVAFPVNLTLTPGRYFEFFVMSSITAGTMAMSQSIAFAAGITQFNIAMWGSNFAGTGNNVMKRFLAGSSSATNSTFPNQIALVVVTGNDLLYPPSPTLIHFDIFGYGTSTNLI